MDHQKSTILLIFGTLSVGAVEAMYVTFNQIQGSYVKCPLFRIPTTPSNQI